MDDGKLGRQSQRKSGLLSALYLRMASNIPNQKPFRTGDNLTRRLLSADMQNLPLDALNALNDHLQNNVGIPASNFGILAEIWPGKVIAAAGGATVFTNQNYWVKRQKISTGGTSDKLPVVADEDLPGFKQVVTAANLSEYVAGSHTLAEDGSVLVLVMGFDSRDGTGRRQYVFIPGAASMALLKVAGSITIGGGGTLSGGMYACHLLTPKPTSINVTGSTFGLSTIMVDNGTSNAYYANLPEMGQTTHDLLASSNTATVVLGLAIGKATDGYTVFAGVLMFPGCS